MKPEPYDQIMDDRAEEEARLAAEEAENAGAIAKAEAQEDMRKGDDDATKMDSMSQINKPNPNR